MPQDTHRGAHLNLQRQARERREPTTDSPARMHIRTLVHTHVQHTQTLGKGNTYGTLDGIKKALLIFRRIIWLFLKVFSFRNTNYSRCGLNEKQN